ncbi:MAG: DNA polymerase/3'-5' exonuclease PolX [Planctomycetota bacterium]
MDNHRIADLIDEIGDLEDLRGGNSFRVRSYHQAAQAVRNASESLSTKVDAGEDLSRLRNIGTSIAGKIAQIVKTGTCPKLEQLRAEQPEAITRLLAIPGLGAKRVRQLQRELDVETFAALRQACEDHRVRELDGWGAKSEAKLLHAIELASQASGRMLRDRAEAQVAAIATAIAESDQVERWTVAGSYRRRKPTCGDLDVLIQCTDRTAVGELLLEQLEIADVIARGREKLSVRLVDGPQVDVRFVEAGAYGAAEMYFTGNKQHNLALRRRANSQHRKLSEYGLFSGDERIASKDEPSVYQALHLDWVPPELREGRGEIEAAAASELPPLIELDQVRGDLQSHSTASDGADSIEDMAAAAQDRGYRFFAITDHSQSQTQAGGLDDEQARRHADRLRAVDDELDGLWLLAGIEVDIRKDGSLDLDAETLRRFDWVVASIHDHFELGEEAQTQRLERAFASGLVDCWGHPTSRMFGKRQGIVFDHERVFDVCARHRVCVEINAQPMRLDLPDELCGAVCEAGALFSLGTDAHSTSSLEFMRYGVDAARRGWLTREHVINTLTVKQLRKHLAARRA